jgi:cation diffusion facilitator family transporter
MRVMVSILALSLVLLFAKAAAWRITGSQGLFSDALESMANVLTASFGIFSVWLAARPPDASHPYGHGRIEFFAAGLEGALVLAAGLAILRESIPALFDPAPLHNLGAGGALAVGAALCNGAAGVFLIRRGRREISPVMIGEGHHLLSDTVTTVGVLLGLLLVQLTGVAWLDPAAACVVGGVVALSGARLLREAANRLMDQAEPEVLDEVARILEERRRPEWVDVHFLRARSAGEILHVDFHLALPRYWELDRAHEVQEGVAREVLQGLGRRGEVLVHADPCHPGLCALCRVPECPERTSPPTETKAWTRETLVEAAPARADAGDLRPGGGRREEGASGW